MTRLPAPCQYQTGSMKRATPIDGNSTRCGGSCYRYARLPNTVPNVFEDGTFSILLAVDGDVSTVFDTMDCKPSCKGFKLAVRLRNAANTDNADGVRA